MIDTKFVISAAFVRRQCYSLFFFEENVLLYTNKNAILDTLKPYFL